MACSVFTAELNAYESVVPAEAREESAGVWNDSLAEAHASLGLIATDGARLEPRMKEQERAIQLNPNYATAHPLARPRARDAAGNLIDPLKTKARLELDPLSMIINAT